MPTTNAQSSTYQFHMEAYANDTLPNITQEACEALKGVSGASFFSTMYLSTLLLTIAVGLTLTLFITLIIAWYPDLYTTKHISQAFCLFSNLVSLSATGFMALSTYIPTANTCSFVQVIYFVSVSLFLVSEATSQAEFYTSIKLPFWHDMYFDKEFAVRWCALNTVLVVVTTAALYWTGFLDCGHSDCPIVDILTLTRNSEVTLVLVALFVTLFFFISLGSLHVFCIAVEKLKVNKVAPKTVFRFPSRDLIKAHLSSPPSLPTCCGPPPKTSLGDGGQASNEGWYYIRLAQQDPDEVNEDAPDGGGGCGHEDSGSEIDCCQKALLSRKEDVDDQAGLTGGLIFRPKKAAVQRQDQPQNQQQRLQQQTSTFVVFKALLKSFRLSLLTLFSYLLLIAPSFGEAFCAIPKVFLDNSTTEYCLSPRESRLLFHHFFNRTLILTFVVLRTAQPAVLMNSDKVLRKKIKDIISDDSEE